MNRSLHRRVRRLESQTFSGPALVKAFGQYKNDGTLPTNERVAQYILNISAQIDQLLYDEDPDYDLHNT